MIARRQTRDTGSREARTIPAKDTALYRGALLEIQRLDAKVHRLEAENGRLRAKLACYEAHEDRWFPHDDTLVLP